MIRSLLSSLYDLQVMVTSSMGEGCWSHVGMVGHSQRLNLGQGCETVGGALHELAHALGVAHEQARRHSRLLGLTASLKTRELSCAGAA